MPLNRREFLGSGAVALATGIGSDNAHAQEIGVPLRTQASPGSEGVPAYGAAALGLGITSAFARFLSGMRYEDLSPAAVHEAQRAVLDWIGCALAGST